MTNDKNLLKEHYEKFIYPKPVEDIDKEFLEKRKVLYADPNFSWHFLWPEKNYPEKDKILNILVAGCGSDQAAILAKCNPRHNFLGIDISNTSIDHQKKLKQKHVLKNLELKCADFREVNYKQKFDYIISTGVIHHLLEPGSALKIFEENLTETGVINLMVYGDKNSYSLNEVKKIFKTLNFDHNLKSISSSRKLINNLNNNHPAKIFANKSPDMNYDAGIVDFLLHKQEHYFDILELINLLDENNLIIKNFFDGKIPSLTKFFLEDIEKINYIRNLDVKKRLELGQILNWNDRNIELVICKKSQKKHSMIYNQININNLYLSPSRSIKYTFEHNKIMVEELFSKNKITYNFISNEKPDWKNIFSGKIKLEESLNKTSLSIDKNNYNLFKILIENFHVDISYYPFEDYINFYAK